MDLYAENILDHYKTPRHHGLLADATVRHEETNTSCGDRVEVTLKIERGIITEVGWEGNGCAISQAGMSLLAETLVGKPKEEVEALTAENMKELLGVPVGLRRLKCATLALEAVRGALESL